MVRHLLCFASVIATLKLAAQAAPPPCRPRSIDLATVRAISPARATLLVCRHNTGETELLVSLVDSTSADTTDLAASRIVIATHVEPGRSLSFIIDGAARRATVEARVSGGSPTVVPADSAPWKASVLVATPDQWRMHASFAPVVVIDSITVTATGGASWRIADVENIAQSTRIASVGPDSQAAADRAAAPRARTSVLALGNVASPAPFAEHTGARASLGMIAIHTSGAQELTLGIAPPRPVFAWSPIQANPNQRGRRVLLDGRPEMEPWRLDRGRFVWLDTRRIDRGAGFAHLQGAASPVGALLTVAEDGELSAAAVRVGRYDDAPLVLRMAAVRDNDRSGYSARHPWLMIGGLSGGTKRVGKTAGAAPTASPASPASSPSFYWEWNTTAPAASPDLRRGAALIGGSMPLPGPLTVVGRHERLSPGFGSRGVSFASLDGIETAEVAVIATARRSQLSFGGDVLAPFRHRDALSTMPFSDDSHEMRGRARWSTFSDAGREVAVETTVGSYRYGQAHLGPYPGGSVSYTASPNREWNWQVMAHAERTPLFAVLAPARAAGVRTLVERRGQRQLTAMLIAAERVDGCGAPLTAPAMPWVGPLPGGSAYAGSTTGCERAGDALAASVLHARELIRHSHLEIEGRWQRQRAALRTFASRLEGPPRLEWRTALNMPVTSTMVLSGSAQCGFETPRTTCDVSVVMSRALVSKEWK